MIFHRNIFTDHSISWKFNNMLCAYSYRGISLNLLPNAKGKFVREQQIHTHTHTHTRSWTCEMRMRL